MTCPKCNEKEHEPGAKFCHNCGTLLSETEVVIVDKTEIERLRRNQAELENLLQKGFAPKGYSLLTDSDLRNLNESKNRLNHILQSGHAPSGFVLVNRGEYDAIRNRNAGNGQLKNWIIGILCATIVVLLTILLFSGSSNESDTIGEKTLEESSIQASFPQDLSGSYIVRKMNGRDDINATVKIYHEGSGYALNVYSSNITRKYTFSYNPSNGEITSEELGVGKARIKKITNEIEISFEGWELLK